MNVWQEMVKEFHTKFDQPVRDIPFALSYEDYLRRIRLMHSELSEFIEAVNKQDIIKQIDALCDLVYVVLGTAVEMGIDLDIYLKEVHKSNMTKSKKVDVGGKITKGKTYKEPKLKDIYTREVDEKCAKRLSNK